MAINYKNSGVDVEAGYKSVDLIKKHVKTTFTDGVITDLGGFSGLFSLGKYSMEEPVLVSGTDGVGTKLKIAFALDKHDTIGIDCVAMCVNDVICSGASPLFFLDYIACGRNVPEKIETIVSGIAEGCRQAKAALVGGETAEMPGLYEIDEYDLAGFAVGIVDKKNIIDGSKIKEGDALIGIASSGIHSNGYSLVRNIFDPTPEKLSVYIEELGSTIGEELIKPTKIYVKAIEELKDKVEIKSIGHITGGGFIENIPRMLKPGFYGEIKKGTWPILPIFNLMKNLVNLEEKDMYNTFNMGIGMIVTVAKEDIEKTIDLLKAAGEDAYLIGEVKKGDLGVVLC